MTGALTYLHLASAYQSSSDFKKRVLKFFIRRRRMSYDAIYKATIGKIGNLQTQLSLSPFFFLRYISFEPLGALLIPKFAIVLCESLRFFSSSRIRMG